MLQIEFGKLLKNLRMAKGLSQEQMSFKTGLTRNFISLIECGNRQPTIKSLFAIADALDEKPSDIIKMLESSIKISDSE